MTYKDACDKARSESENGYVQHVNQVHDGYVSPDDPNGYTVSDWYDADVTVASFENGREL
jgi:hypothetical protein